MHASSARTRLCVAALVAAVSLLALVAAPALVVPGEVTAQGTPELPDLDPSAPYGMRIQTRSGAHYLGFGSATLNAGGGPLRVRGALIAPETMNAEQLTRPEEGDGVLSPDVGRLQFVRAGGHEHWHYLDFIRYELRVADGTPTVKRDRKQGFCLADAFSPDWCGKNTPQLGAILIGMNPGGLDVYDPNLEGQEIEIDRASVPSGRYLLVHHVNPAGVLIERALDNNASSALVDIRWRGGRPSVRTVRACPATWWCGRGAPPAAGAPALGEPAARRTVAEGEAELLAQSTMRRVYGAPAARGLACRREFADSFVCASSWRAGRRLHRGEARIWYVNVGANQGWYYRVDVHRRPRGCAPGARCERLLTPQRGRTGSSLPARCDERATGRRPC